jgi:hypothetical protein
MGRPVKVVARPAPVLGGAVDRGRAWWRYVALGIIAVLALLAFVFADLVAGGSGRAGTGLEAAGPTHLEQGLPVGYAHTPAGAEAAAARFALLSFGVLDGRVSEPPARIAALYATPAFRATLARLLDATRARSEAHAALLAHAAIHRSVLATRLAAYSPQEAGVETWESAVVMVGRPPLVGSGVLQSWLLRYERGDWRIAEAGTSEAPLAGMSADRRAEVLQTFTGSGDASAGY